MGEIIGGYLVPHPPIIVPEVGKDRRREVGDTVAAMERVAREVRDTAPDTIVLTTPHGHGFADSVRIPDAERFSGDLAAFGAPGVAFSFAGDPPLAHRIQAICRREGIACGCTGITGSPRRDGGEELDHGALVPLSFVAPLLPEFRLLSIPVPFFDLPAMYRFGSVLAEAARELPGRVLLLASGDLSHCLRPGAPCGYRPEAARYDEEICRIVREGDDAALQALGATEMREAAECGTRSFAVLFGALAGREKESEIYAYDDAFGVGYLTARIAPAGGRA